MTDQTIRIEEAGMATPDLVDAIIQLTRQLSPSAPAPTAAHIAEIVASPSTVLFIASDEASIVGMLTLAIFRIPTGTRALIEDVVVDQAARGRGVGEALTRRAIDRARQAGARTIHLSSRASREAANRLYQRLGFVLRDTNSYRYSIDQ